MRLTHTSPSEITEIKTTGLFGDCLCFSDREYAMGSVNAVYAIEIEESNVIDGDCLDVDGESEKAAIAELIRICDENIDADEAFDLLCENVTAWKLLVDRIEPDMIAEISWDVQRLQGRIAAQDGFDAFAGRDEQGKVYIVSMSGKLDRLERVR